MNNKSISKLNLNIDCFSNRNISKDQVHFSSIDDQNIKNLANLSIKKNLSNFTNLSNNNLQNKNTSRNNLHNNNICFTKSNSNEYNKCKNNNSIIKNENDSEETKEKKALNPIFSIQNSSYESSFNKDMKNNEIKEENAFEEIKKKNFTEKFLSKFSINSDSKNQKRSKIVKEELFLNQNTLEKDLKIIEESQFIKKRKIINNNFSFFKRYLPPNENDLIKDSNKFANKSCGIFTRQNKFRVKLFLIVQNEKFDKFILSLIILNSILLSVSLSFGLNSNLQLDFFDFADFFFLVIFFFEALIKIVSWGFFEGEKAYIKKAWNNLDFLVVILSFIYLIPNFKNFDTLKIIRMLRPIRTISFFPGLNRLVSMIGESIRQMLSLFVLMLFFFLLFGVFGTTIWSGLLTYRCRETSKPVNGTWKIINGSDNICGGSYQCPENSNCLSISGYYEKKIFFFEPKIDLYLEQRIPQLNYGYTNFDNFMNSVFSVFQVMTLQGWVSIMYMIQNGYNYFSAALYFICVVLVMNYFILNFTIAIMMNTCRNLSFDTDVLDENENQNENEKNLKNSVQKKNKYISNVDTLNNKIKLNFFMKYLKKLIGFFNQIRFFRKFDIKESKWNYKKNKLFANRILYRNYDDMNIENKIVSSDININNEEIKENGLNGNEIGKIGCRNNNINIQKTNNTVNKKNINSKYSFHLNNKFSFYCFVISKQPIFRYFIYLIVIINVIILAFNDVLVSQEAIKIYDSLNIILIFVLFLEIFLKICGYGFRNYIKNYLNILDLVITSINSLELFTSKKSYFGILRIIRLYRLIKLTKNWKTLSIIIKCITYTSKEIINYLILISILIYVFALIGVTLFRKKLKFNSENLFDLEKGESPYLNFDNIFKAFISVFTLLIGDGWHLLMYDCLRSEATEKFSVYIYFISVIVLLNIIMMNLVVAFLVFNFESARKRYLYEEQMREWLSKQKRVKIKRSYSFSFLNNLEIRNVLKDQDMKIYLSLVKQKRRYSQKQLLELNKFSLLVRENQQRDINTNRILDTNKKDDYDYFYANDSEMNDKGYSYVEKKGKTLKNLFRFNTVISNPFDYFYKNKNIINIDVIEKEQNSILLESNKIIDNKNKINFEETDKNDIINVFQKRRKTISISKNSFYHKFRNKVFNGKKNFKENENTEVSDMNTNDNFIGCDFSNFNQLSSINKFEKKRNMDYRIIDDNLAIKNLIDKELESSNKNLFLDSFNNEKHIKGNKNKSIKYDTTSKWNYDKENICDLIFRKEKSKGPINFFEKNLDNKRTNASNENTTIYNSYKNSLFEKPYSKNNTYIRDTINTENTNIGNSNSKIHRKYSNSVNSYKIFINESFISNKDKELKKKNISQDNWKKKLNFNNLIGNNLLFKQKNNINFENKIFCLDENSDYTENIDSINYKLFKKNEETENRTKINNENIKIIQNNKLCENSLIKLNEIYKEEKIENYNIWENGIIFKKLKNLSNQKHFDFKNKNQLEDDLKDNTKISNEDLSIDNENDIINNYKNFSNLGNINKIVSEKEIPKSTYKNKYENNPKLEENLKRKDEKYPKTNIIKTVVSSISDSGKCLIPDSIKSNLKLLNKNSKEISLNNFLKNDNGISNYLEENKPKNRDFINKNYSNNLEQPIICNKNTINDILIQNNQNPNLIIKNSSLKNSSNKNTFIKTLIKKYCSNIIEYMSESSLLIFHQKMCLRRFLIILINKSWFETLTIIIIFLSCIIILLESPYNNPNSVYSKSIKLADNIFTFLFFFEMIAKIIAYGFLFDKTNKIENIFYEYEGLENNDESGIKDKIKEKKEKDYKFKVEKNLKIFERGITKLKGVENSLGNVNEEILKSIVSKKINFDLMNEEFSHNKKNNSKNYDLKCLRISQSTDNLPSIQFINEMNLHESYMNIDKNDLNYNNSEISRRTIKEKIIREIYPIDRNPNLPINLNSSNIYFDRLNENEIGRNSRQKNNHEKRKNISEKNRIDEEINFKHVNNFNKNNIIDNKAFMIDSCKNPKNFTYKHTSKESGMETYNNLHRFEENYSSGILENVNFTKIKLNNYSSSYEEMNSLNSSPTSRFKGTEKDIMKKFSHMGTIKSKSFRNRILNKNNNFFINENTNKENLYLIQDNNTNFGIINKENCDNNQDYKNLQSISKGAKIKCKYFFSILGENNKSQKSNKNIINLSNNKNDNDNDLIFPKNKNSSLIRKRKFSIDENIKNNRDRNLNITSSLNKKIKHSKNTNDKIPDFKSIFSRSSKTENVKKYEDELFQKLIKKAYLRDYFNMMDFLVIIASVIYFFDNVINEETIAIDSINQTTNSNISTNNNINKQENSDGSVLTNISADKIITNTKYLYLSLRLLRSLRALRPLRMINKLEGLKIIVYCLLLSAGAIFYMFLIGIFILFIYALVGLILFSGTLGTCSNIKMNNKTECVDKNHTWTSYENNFDTIGSSMITLFQMATASNWVDIMRITIANNNNNQFILGYFISFMLVGCIFILNLAVTVIVDNFSILNKRAEGISLLTNDQLAWVKVMKYFLKYKPIPHYNLNKMSKLRRILYKIVNHKAFNIFINLMILINVIFLFIQYDGISSNLVDIQSYFFYFSTFCFNLEMVMRIYVYRKYYFIENWNKYDLIVIILSNISIVLNIIKFFKFQNLEMDKFQILPVLIRGIRILRVLRLINLNESLKEYFYTIIILFPSLANIGSLILIIFTIYSVIGNNLFAIVMHGNSINKDNNFHYFIGSFLALIRVTTGDNWSDMMNELSIPKEGCIDNQSYEDLIKDGPKGCGGYLSYWYFLSFIILNNLVIINLFIAVVVESFFNNTEKPENIIEDRLIQQFFQIWGKYDVNIEYKIQPNEFVLLMLELNQPLGIRKEDFYEKGKNQNYYTKNIYMSHNCLFFADDRLCIKILKNLKIEARGGYIHIIDAIKLICKRAVIDKSEFKTNNVEINHKIFNKKLNEKFFQYNKLYRRCLNHKTETEDSAKMVAKKVIKNFLKNWREKRRNKMRTVVNDKIQESDFNNLNKETDNNLIIENNNLCLENIKKKI